LDNGSESKLSSKSFNTNEDGDPVPNTNALKEAGYTDQQIQIISMFQDSLPTQLNPIELLNSLESRPTADMRARQLGRQDVDLSATPVTAATPRHEFGTLQGRNKTKWDSFNAELTDAVQQFEPATQLATNKIATQQQVGDRKFALANNPLAKA